MSGGAVERVYRALLGLLPPAVGSADREEMAAVFGSLWREARRSGWRRRVKVLATTFGRLPGVILLEWRDQIASRRGNRRRGRDGMHGLWSSIRHGGRSLAKSPSFTWSVVLLLGLGIGAVTTIFSVVDHVVLRDLPYPAADRLVEIENGSHSAPTYERISGMRTLESVVGIFTTDAILTGGDEPVRLTEAQVTRDFFTLFGARPAIGRLLGGADFPGGDAVVLSHDVWRSAFGGDSTVVGRTLRIDGVQRVVVGVAEAGFGTPEALRGGEGDFWRPVDWSQEYYSGDDYMILSIAARLAPGTTVEQAQAEADVVAATRAEQNPEQFGGDLAPLPVTPFLEATVGRVRRGLMLVLGAVTLLLLVACVNVAHLFMARGMERTREMTVRRALGAGTGALARQLSVEALVVGLGGALVGVVLAYAGIGALRAVGPDSLPRLDAIGVDLRVMGFAAAIGVGTALLFGLLPALRLASRDGANPLHLSARGGTASRGTHAVRKALVVAEVALSLILTAQAGWLVRSFVDLHATELGFRTADIWTMPLTPTGLETAEGWNRTARGIRESLETVPGVQAATFGLTLPLQHVGGNTCCWRTDVTFADDTEEYLSAIHPVEAAYFDIFDLRVLAGRTWDAREDPMEAGGGSGGPTPVVISEPLALRVFGGAQAAIGRAMTLAGNPFTVVGVVADNRHYGPDQDHGAATYIPAGAITFGTARVHMAVRVDAPRPGLARSLAEAVWRAEPDLPVPVVRPMEQWAGRATARARFLSGLFSAFGVVALLLVAGGLAGTLLYTVRTRRRELGIRLALGATTGNVERSVLRSGVKLALLGVAIGGVGAWMSGRLLEGFIAEIQARDSATFLITVAVLMTVALLSSWLPARRAAATDPMETLREE